jgi:dolichyl-phosphate beta-glucosyltransferase
MELPFSAPLELSRMTVRPLPSLISPPGSPGPTDHDLTVIVPAYNEQDRLPATLAGLRDYLNPWGVDYRVVVIDNASTDKTGQIADSFGPRFSTLAQPIPGKGAAIRLGMQACTGAVLAFTDADLPYDLDSLRKGYESIVAGKTDVVFGARDLVESEMRARRRLIRTVATTVFREVVRLLVSRHVTDTQCGLKLFRREAAWDIFTRTTIDGFAFDAEVVYLTHRLRLPYERVAVTLINEYSSTLSLSRHALPMFLDVVRLRLRSLRGAHQLAGYQPGQTRFAIEADTRRRAA